MPVQKAREEAQRAKAVRQNVEAQWPAVDKVSTALRDHLERNHFGDKLEQAIRRRASPT